MQKILIVEDESTIREVEKAYLERAGYKVDEASDGAEAVEKFKENSYVLVVLDLNLPKLDGIEVCREIRKTSRVPIIMLTARVEEFDEIIGLEIGADDYIKKPFSPNILVARINSILRRFKDESEIKIGDILINPERMEVKKDDKLLTLTTTQFNILFLLASHPGRVYTREQILEHLYIDLDSRYTMERTIDAHIKSIRKLLEADPRSPNYIITIIGKGYKFMDNL